MKRLPIGTILVPIETRSNALFANVKVFTETINYHFKLFTTLWILGDQMSSFMPRYT